MAFTKPVLDSNNALNDAAEGDDGAAYATSSSVVKHATDDHIALGNLSTIDGLTTAALLGMKAKFTTTGNRYTITAASGVSGNHKNFAIYGICSSGALFVAVGAADGTDGYILTSPDGITWTERTNPKNIALRAVAWDGTQFCAVGDADGTNSYIITSPDGITWTEQSPTVAKNIGLNAICWNGTIWCAVGDADGTDSYILTSTDAVTWTERAPTVSVNVALYGIAWNGSLFVAVGQGIGGGCAYIATSPDGTTWTQRVWTLAVRVTDLYAVAWDGSQFCCVGAADGDALIITSATGTGSWTEQANPKNFALYSIAWNGSLWCAVGAADGTDAYVITSADGATWTERSNWQNYALNCIVWDRGQFVAAGAADGTDAYIALSDDGIFWPQHAITLFEALQTIDIGDSFTVRAGLCSAQQDPTAPAFLAADNKLSPVTKGLENTAYYLRAHAPNFLTDGGFESGAFSPNWTAEATNPWVIESTTELEGAYSASWDLVASKYLRQTGTGMLLKDRTYRLVYKAKSVTANPTAGAITVNLFQTGTGTALDASAASTTPAITTTATWFAQDFTPDFSTDNWYLNIAGDSTKANGATEITMDEFYLYEKPTINTLNIGRHNLVGKSSIEVRSWKMSPLRSTASIAGGDGSTLATFNCDTADTITQALTASNDPVVELYIPASTGFVPQFGEVYIGDSWTLSHFAKGPLDPYRTNDDGLREMTLSFDSLDGALRTTTIEALFRRVRKRQPVWVSWNAETPIMGEITDRTCDAPFNPFRVQLRLSWREKV